MVSTTPVARDLDRLAVAHQNYVLDIVIRPDVACYHSQSGHCADCNTRVQICASGQPSLAKGAACYTLGSKLIAHAIYLHDYHASKCLCHSTLLVCFK